MHCMSTFFCCHRELFSRCPPIRMKMKRSNKKKRESNELNVRYGRRYCVSHWYPDQYLTCSVGAIHVIRSSGTGLYLKTIQRHLQFRVFFFYLHNNVFCCCCYSLFYSARIIAVRVVNNAPQLLFASVCVYVFFFV